MVGTACANVTPTTASASVEPFAYPTTEAELEAYLSQPLSDFFDTARFEIVANWPDTALHPITGEVDLPSRELSAVAEDEEDEEETYEIFGHGQLLRDRLSHETTFTTKSRGPWFAANAETFGLYLTPYVESPGDYDSMLVDRSSVHNPEYSREFVDLGFEAVRGFEVRHLRFSKIVVSNTELWGGGEDILATAAVDVWIDAEGRPVRTQLEFPFVDLVLTQKTDFFGFEESLTIELPPGLDLRSSGEPLGETSAEIAHADFGTQTFGPEAHLDEWAELGKKQGLIGFSYPLGSKDGRVYSATVRFSFVGDSPVGSYRPASAISAQVYPGLEPSTFAVTVVSRDEISGDSAEPRPATATDCLDGSSVAGELQVLEADLIRVDDRRQFPDIDRLAVVFEYTCAGVGSEPVMVSGFRRINATR